MYLKGNEESKLAKAYREYKDCKVLMKNIGEQFGMVKILWEAIEEYFERPEEDIRRCVKQHKNLEERLSCINCSKPRNG